MKWWLRAGRAGASFMVEESCYLWEGQGFANCGGKQRDARQGDCCEQGIQCEDLSQEAEGLQGGMMGALIGAEG